MSPNLASLNSFCLGMMPFFISSIRSWYS